MLTQCTPNAHPVHTWRFIRKAHVCELFQNCRSWIPKTSTVSYKKNKSTNLGAFFIAIFNIFSITIYTMQPLLNILSLSSWVLLKACCLMGTKPLPGQIHTTCNKWFAISKLTHCGLVTPYDARDLGKHWLMYRLVAWRHQAIAWTIVD